ncbi:MAG: DNA topoisomerase (ATP-hydrolyzing) subunit B [Anaeroplasmataceae bacterium]
MDFEKKEAASDAYDGNQIQVLEGLEPVRVRPGMYIGSTSERGLHHLVWEIVDNSIDEALAGYCNHIEIDMLKGEIISVTDNGRGMPTDIHPKTGKSTVETIFTVLHAGGKFGGGSYKVSGGLHGVGASVVNALSTWLKVKVRRNHKLYSMEFNRGIANEGLICEGDTELENGSQVIFKADPEIFTETTVYNYETLRNRVQQLAFLNKGLRITLRDLRSDDEANHKTDSYFYEGGIVEYVKFLNENRTPIHKDILYIEKTSEFDRVVNESITVKDTVSVEIAMQYTGDYNPNIYSFANNIATHEGGYHEDGFKMAIAREIKKYAVNSNMLKKDNLKSEDTLEGLTAIVSVKHSNPQFEGQTKTKLGNLEVRAFTSQVCQELIETYLLEHPNEAKQIIEKALSAAHAREAAQKAKEAIRKTPLSGFKLASKLADCHSRDASKCEMYIVEGDSAGGSAKNGRDSEYQAILPLRGKILNVEKVRQARAFENNEIVSMLQAIGTGYGEDFDIEKARYHKIVIMTDADVDGAHIATLLLTFFFRYMPQLIDAGYIYLAKPPLYRIQVGKKFNYAYSDEELEELKKVMGGKPEVQRYKGLGEMDASQLWETTMDPAHRILLRVTMDDALLADQTFSMLMGEDVGPRREFIQENAQYATIDL